VVVVVEDTTDLLRWSPEEQQREFEKIPYLGVALSKALGPHNPIVRFFDDDDDDNDITTRR
jgi:hypothetical protein